MHKGRGFSSINIYLYTFVYLRLPTYRKAMLKAHVFFAWDFGVQFDKLTVRAVTEPVEVQSNAENDSVAVASLTLVPTLASSLPLWLRLMSVANRKDSWF